MVVCEHVEWLNFKFAQFSRNIVGLEEEIQGTFDENNKCLNEITYHDKHECRYYEEMNM